MSSAPSTSGVKTAEHRIRQIVRLMCNRAHLLARDSIQITVADILQQLVNAKGPWIVPGALRASSLERQLAFALRLAGGPWIAGPSRKPPLQGKGAAGYL